MEYTKKKFSVPYMSKKYTDNWEKTFRPRVHIIAGILKGQSGIRKDVDKKTGYWIIELDLGTVSVPENCIKK